MYGMIAIFKRTVLFKAQSFYGMTGMPVSLW